MNIPNVSAPPLFGAPIGNGVEMQAIRTTRDRPTPDRGPEQLRAQFEGPMNQKLIQVGFQVAEGAIRATEESFFARGKREFALGPEGGTGTEELRQSAQGKIQDATIDGELNPFGLPQHDPMLLGGSVSSLAELEEVLAQTNYERWTDVIDAAMPGIRDTVLARTPLLSRRRLERWINEQGDSLRARYAVEAASAQTDMARNLQMEQIQNAINDGDVDSATALVLNGVQTGLLTSQQSMMLTMSISNLAPINYHSNRLASILSTQGEEAALQHLGQIQNQLTSGEESNPVFRDEETGLYRIGNVTQAQYDSIEEQFYQRLGARRNRENFQAQTRVQAAESSLLESLYEGTLTREEVERFQLTREVRGIGNPTYDRFMKIITGIEQEANEGFQYATGELYDAFRADYVDQLYQMVYRGEYGNEQFQAMTEDLFNVRATVDQEGNVFLDPQGERLFPASEAADLIQELQRVNDVQAPFSAIMETFTDSLDDLLMDMDREDRPAQRSRNVRMTDALRSYANQLTASDMNPEQIREAMRQASDNLVIKAALGEGERMFPSPINIATILDESNNIVTRDGNGVINEMFVRGQERAAVNQIRGVQRRIEEQDYSGVSGLSDYSSDLIAYSNLVDGKIRYDIPLIRNVSVEIDTATQQVFARVDGARNNIQMSLIPNEYKDPSMPREIHLAYRMNGNNPELAIYHQRNGWTFVSQDARVASVLGLTPAPRQSTDVDAVDPIAAPQAQSPGGSDLSVGVAEPDLSGQSPYEWFRDSLGNWVQRRRDERNN